MSKRKSKSTYRNNLKARSEEARTVRKIVLIIILSILLIFIIGGYSGYTYIKQALQPVDPDSNEEVKVEIPLGSSSSSIGSILEKKGIIKDGRIFRFYTKFKNQFGFQAGKYNFTKSMTLDEIIASLKTGKIVKDALFKVTIPEGKSIDEIAEIFADKTKIKKAEFLKVVNDKAFIDKLMEKYPAILTKDIKNKEIRTPLEGYLFAATYNFYDEKYTVKSIVEMMLEKTSEVVGPYLDQLKEKDISIHEAITLASLVEKEAKTEDQRRKIAGIFYNRLDEGMKLQTDPTVLYALGKHKDKVLLSDLKIKSPYNTYEIEGLPVGPIANFSESSLEAIIKPEQSDYLYFLHDAEGNIHYAKTHEEHLKLKQQYIK
ncbi:endolytic transglycosylase MltG [Paracerasibacillus soli]|uniref:Endolytic murein transglycosylase n=1 Tax=Paracerasibacillus soli TaxID=480284 RepID=A0ABU5CQ94_9BACI|nr:endolytic transglycosylase MltG [Virgibacillus soli]MDY0408543.1 endolytic transglycosylase MltG [Virgibacillus soli]